VDRLAALIMEDAERILARLPLGDLCDKRLLITGASGLIGGYLVACFALLHSMKGFTFSLTVVARSEPPLYFEDLMRLVGDYEIVRGDLTDTRFCEGLPQSDVIIHAACYGQPGKFMEEPIKTLQLNTSGLLSLFSRLAPDGKLLFLSSSEVYSGCSDLPYKESQIGISRTTHPRACYIEGKRCGEAICHAYRQAGVQATSVRVALAYGPGTRMGDRRVLNALIEKGLKGRIALLDHGEAKRTYCYVTDAVEIMWNALIRGTEPIYNVGGASRTTIKELALEIGDYLHVPVTIPTTADRTEGAPDDVWLDMTKAQSEFGKSEYVSLKEGLSRTIEWQKVLYAR